MKKYIGVKVVLAEPMTRKAYNDYRGWELPADENGDDMGYLVEYPNGSGGNHPNHEGYISWCPVKQFEEANQPTDGMTFGHAIEAARKGLKITRAGWNGKGMFVYLVKGVVLEKQLVRGEASEALKDTLKTDVKICSHLDMKAANGSIIVGWLASQTDMLADDWQIVD